MLLMQIKVYCLYTSKSEPLISWWTQICLTTDRYTYTTFDDVMSIDKETGSLLDKKFSGRPQPKEILCECSYQLENARTTVHMLLKT